MPRVSDLRPGVLDPGGCAGSLRKGFARSAAAATADSEEQRCQAQSGCCKDGGDAEAAPARPPPSLLDQRLELIVFRPIAVVLQRARWS